MSDTNAIRSEIKQPHGWRALLPWVRAREAEKLRSRIETIEFFEARSAEEYHRVCETLEDATYRAEVAEGQVKEVCRLLSQRAPDLRETHLVLFQRLDGLLQLSQPKHDPQTQPRP